MATIGLSRPYYALYSADGGVVTYTAGGILAKAIEFSASVESGDDKNLYADNGIAESDRSFAGGTISITTDDLTQDASAAILGITPSQVEVNGLQVTELVYDDDAVAPDLGFGVVIKKKRGGAYKYRAVVLTKIKFNLPEDAATTQGETIEWQTPAIEGVIMRDDGEKHAWKREATFDSEKDARDYIEHILELELGALTVTSVAGLTENKTAITISPALQAGHSYKYKISGSAIGPVGFNELVTTGYTAWDGESEILATSDDEILIVEVDSYSRAKRAGMTVVVSNDE